MRLSVREGDGFRTLMLGPEGWTEQAAELFTTERCDGIVMQKATFADLEFLLPLEPLRMVSLGAATVRDTSALFEKHALERLTIGLKARDLRGIGRLTGLTDVSVPFRKGIEELACVSGLRSLSIEEWPSGTDLDVIGKHPQVRQLWLALKRTAEISSTWFTSAPALEEVSLYSGRLTDTAGLAALTALESLRFADAKVADLTFVPGTSRLRSLQLDNSGDVASLEPLRHHPRLAEIRLIGATRIVDGDMAPLFDLPQRELIAVEHSYDNYTHSAADLRRRFPPH
jgi:hypothetical protein